ncbi:hypothetical protein FZEAL_7449 [Fusarium zealandicum]|uniref:J domain-containing protein n=1 Tax=Fusarium zealandicum TaxID=1053134 RepID=A0A8H4UGN5_9HYPO|nr:hypothetical protein FZEAL_7449 [Fusarium zealandicum]
MGTQRDYYADLELPPTADAADIRKQYRKLALKYHPDRNPGREQEVNTQFQIIQAAHEVLSDPDAKAKHDASRARGRYPTSSGVKGNPWSNVSAQYPPPPRRNNAGAAGAARTTPSGAQRWHTRFSSGVPPTAKQYATSDPEAKKNAARAFENMRKGSSAKASEQPRPPPPPPPPRTESARQRAEASFGARKTGFHPRTAMGDEPPVASSNYSSRSASERYSQAYPQEPPPATPPRPPPMAMPADPLSQFRDRDSWADPRQSSPYTSHGGEKTNPFDGIPLNRTKSTRENPPRDQSSSDSDYFNRQRSASTPKERKSEDSPPNSRAPEQPSVTRDPADRPKAPLRKTRSGFKNAPQVPDQQPPNASNNGTPSESQNNNPGGPSMYDKPSSAMFNHLPFSSTSSKCRKYQEPGAVWTDVDPYDGCPCNSATGSCHPSPSGRQDSSHQLTPFERHQADFLDKLINNMAIESSTKKTTKQTCSLNYPRASDRANKVHSNSFSFPVDDDTFASPSPDPGRFARSSTDEINTSFVEGEDATGWNFNAGGPEQGSPTKPRPQTGGRAGRRSPRKRPPVNRTDTSSVPPESEKPEPAKAEPVFNPEGWNDKFGPQTFFPQPSQSKSISPTRSNRASSKKPKGSKKPSNPTLIDDSSSDEDEEGLKWRGRKAQAEPPVVESPQAMDIDSPPASTSMPPPRPPKIPSPQPPQPTVSPQPSRPAAQSAPPATEAHIPGTAGAFSNVRNINVEPSRPEWRPGNAEGMNGQDATTESPQKGFNPNNVGSEDSEEFRASFADLRNVAPFAQQSSGLKSFADLKDNLPFESKASPEIPIKLPTVHPLVFPTAPVAPQLPAAVTVNGVQPDMASWEQYVKDFENYMQNWDTFNGQVVDHFTTRKSHTARVRGEKGYSFLEARSDTGIQEYYSWLEQDMDVRRRWSAACEEHEQRFREFMAFRMKMN